jgi:hypothetical protein
LDKANSFGVWLGWQNVRRLCRDRFFDARFSSQAEGFGFKRSTGGFWRAQFCTKVARHGQ